MTNPTMNLLLFAMLPYVALFVFFLGTIMRYRKAPFTYSSLSSQFLENNQHFWGLTALHYGIFAILLGHLMGLLIPRQVLLWNSRPLRLYVLEIFSLAFALMALVGFVGVIERRIRYPKARTVTSPADWIIESMLILQAAAGIYVAIFYPWGTSWYSTSAAPYLHSIFFFRPDISYLVTMPFIVKFHVVNGWLIVGFFPFTRLVHALVAPLPYLWRKPQLARWYGIGILPVWPRRPSGVRD
jgi:nitrate reductase gamma subunit